MVVKSPSKLNLILRILGRKRDGYHRLWTWFHRISLADEMRLLKAKSGFKLTCSNAAVPCDETNLITRAYRLLQKRFPKLGGVTVHLKKQVPMGAGLGGGSANAATFLLAMKRLYKLRISHKDLVKMGAKLGADVPFFLFGVKNAIGTGVGDKISPVKIAIKSWFVLVISKQGLSTARVYKSLPKSLSGLPLTKLSRSVTIGSDFLQGKFCPPNGHSLQNDLEEPAIKLRPSLRKIIRQLQALGVPAQVTGSGPTVFAMVTHQAEAKRLAKKARAMFPSKRILICSTW